MKINIKTISKLSGFSPATVSNALNNKKGVNAETAKKIIKIAQEYGYIHESKITNIKLVLYKDSGMIFSDSPFFAALLEGIENESRRSGYSTTIFNLYKTSSDYQERLLQILNDSTSAILFMGTELSEQDAKMFENISVPLVMLDSWFENLDFNAVLMNNVDSVFQAVQSLIDKGHQRIGYLKSSIRIQNFRFRQEGYERALHNRNLEVDTKYFFSVPPTLDGAYIEMDQILQKKPDLPTAFFADNDIIALGAMKAFQKNGYRIPEDLSFIGFDDLPFCNVFIPALTTIRVFKQEMGQLAVQRLIELIKTNTTLKIKIQICNELIERDSVCTLKSK